MLTIDGAPFYVCDLNQTTEFEGKPGKVIPYHQACKLHGSDEKMATNIYFFVLGENHLHGICPEKGYDSWQTGSRLPDNLPWLPPGLRDNVIVRWTIDPDSSFLVFHLLWPVSIALCSLGSLAMIKNATIPAGGVKRY